MGSDVRICDPANGCPPDTHNLHCRYPDCDKGKVSRAECPASNPAIRKCPFCGSAGEAYVCSPMIDLSPGPTYVRCNHCWAQGPKTTNRQRAIDAWNGNTKAAP